MRARATILGETLLSDEWGTLKRYDVAYRRADGGTQRLHREVYDHGGAAAVLLCNRAAGSVVLTRQFRLPVQLNGDDPALLEVCAGLLDGDTPEACARREAEEETGYRIEELVHVVDAYMSPGSLTEKAALFLGFYEPHHRVSSGGGLAHEGEEIEVVEMPFATALGMIGTGGIIDAKTVLLLHYAALKQVFPDRPAEGQTLRAQTGPG